MSAQGGTGLCPTEQPAFRLTATVLRPSPDTISRAVFSKTLGTYHPLRISTKPLVSRVKLVLV